MFYYLPLFPTSLCHFQSNSTTFNHPQQCSLHLTSPHFAALHLTSPQFQFTSTSLSSVFTSSDVAFSTNFQLLFENGLPRFYIIFSASYCFFKICQPFQLSTTIFYFSLVFPTRSLFSTIFNNVFNYFFSRKDIY